MSNEHGAAFWCNKYHELEQQLSEAKEWSKKWEALADSNLKVAVIAQKRADLAEAERDALKARIEQNQEPAGVLVGELWYEGSKPEDWTFDVRPLYADPIPSPDTQEIIRKAREDALPDGWILDKSHVNDIQEKSIAALINRSKQAHFVDVKVRVNGEWETYQADWIKHMKEIK